MGGRGGGPRLLPAHLPPSPSSSQQSAGTPRHSRHPRPPARLRLVLRAKSPPASRWGRVSGRWGEAGSTPRLVLGVTCTAMAVMLRRARSRAPPRALQPLRGCSCFGSGPLPGGGAGRLEGGGEGRGNQSVAGRARLAPPPFAARFTLSQRWRPRGAPGQGQGRGGRAPD